MHPEPTAHPLIPRRARSRAQAFRGSGRQYRLSLPEAAWIPRLPIVTER